MKIPEKTRHRSNPRCYSAYGYHNNEHCHTLLGFVGEHYDNFGSIYLLGNGYRAYSTALMRFHSPDNLSPFDNGGLNAYAYSLNNPINMTDRTGHSPTLETFRNPLYSKLDKIIENRNSPNQVFDKTTTLSRKDYKAMQALAKKDYKESKARMLKIIETHEEASSHLPPNPYLSENPDVRAYIEKFDTEIRKAEYLLNHDYQTRKILSEFVETPYNSGTRFALLPEQRDTVRTP